MAHTNSLADTKTNEGYNNWTKKQDMGLISAKKSKKYRYDKTSNCSQIFAHSY